MCFTANEALARVATLGLLPNMILYLMGNYHLHLSQATYILLLSVATTNFTPLVGAFIADSYLGRFLSVGLGSIITFLVLFLSLLSFSAPYSQLYTSIYLGTYLSCSFSPSVIVIHNKKRKMLTSTLGYMLRNNNKKKSLYGK